MNKMYIVTITVGRTAPNIRVGLGGVHYTWARAFEAISNLDPVEILKKERP